MPLAGMLRPGNANAGVAADHVHMLDLLLAQLTEAEQQRLVIRTDTAACTHAFLQTLHQRGVGYSVGFYARDNVAAANDHNHNHNDYDDHHHAPRADGGRDRRR